MTDQYQCIHCGDDCGKSPIFWDEKPFCCNGCQTVYQLLNENRLNQYYRIETMPGVKIAPENEPGNEKYAFLDLEEIRTKLLDFTGNGIAKVRFFIPAIHCASCIWLLENLQKLNPAILHSIVNFPSKEVSITYRENEISLRKVVELLASIHYMPEINLQNIDKRNFRKKSREHVVKIGIAGFAFLNSMIYNFPQYLPGKELLDPVLKNLFGWLSFALALPVVVYCANDYFLTAYKGLKSKVISIDLPIVFGLLALFGQSTYEIIMGYGIGYIDSLNGLVFFLLIGKWYQGKTYQALSFERDYRTYFPVAVTVLSEGTGSSVPIEKLRPSDRVLIRNGEIIPADSRLLKGTGSIDYSFVTGESLPVRIESGEFIYAGGKQTGGAIEIVVEKEVEQSYLTQLWNQVNSRPDQTGQLSTIMNRVSQYFTLIILFIAAGSAAYWMVHDRSRAIFAFASVLIIACPCALAMTIPFTYGSTLRQFGRRGFFLKNIHVIEKLLKTTTVVFDKTGTLTIAKSSEISFLGEKLTDEIKAAVKSLVFQSTHPVSRILSDHLKDEPVLEVEQFSEIPSLGVSGKVGKLDIKIGSHYFINGKTVPEGLKDTRVWLSVNKNIYGYFRIGNKYREGLSELTAGLGKSFDLHLISGDNDSEKVNLLPFFQKESNLNFNRSPADKLNYVRKLQSEGKHVIMIGDGLNDAGALAESNVGIIIADDVHNFSPACDAILQSENFSKLNQFVRFIHYSRVIVYLSFVISFIYNLIGLSFAVRGILSPIVAAVLMPLSSVSVIAFATFSVSATATRIKL